MHGRDMSQLRAFNKRVVLSLLLDQGAKSKAEIARETGLSSQGASIIVNALLDDRLLTKLDKVRGQIGQPSTPVSANPDGAYSLGLHLGHCDIEAVLVNLVGEVVHTQTAPTSLSSPDECLAIAIRLARSCVSKLEPAAQARIIGLGVAMRYNLEFWSEELALKSQALDGWRDENVADALSAALGLPVTIYNDAEAACCAEMVLGSSLNSKSAFYIYLGAFVGGSVVIDGKIYRGEQFKAGSIGSIPCSRTNGSGKPDQLISVASIVQLESALNGSGLNGRRAVREGGVEEAESYFENWANTAAPELARAIFSAIAIMDCRTIVLDGLLNSNWKTHFTQKVQLALNDYNHSGLTSPAIRTGSLGQVARVVGAALLPLRAWVAPDTDISSRRNPS